MKGTITLVCFLLVCLCAATIVLGDGDPVTCEEDDFNFYPAIEKCLHYQSSGFRVIWSKAVDNCKVYPGGELFYPANDAEFNASITELSDGGGNRAWLGVRASHGDYETSDELDFENIWTGTYGLTNSQTVSGFLEVNTFSSQFRYRPYYYWLTFRTKRYYICGAKPCRIDCDRLDALIEALEALIY